MNQPHRVHLRVLASPPLELRESDVRRHLPASAALLAVTVDRDVNVTALVCSTAPDDLTPVTGALMQAIGGHGARGRTVRCDVQPQAGAGEVDDASLRALAVASHGALSCPVFVGRRVATLSAWRSLRPVTWGRRGLQIAAGAQPMLPFSGSESEGVAIEVGAPTLIYKGRLSGMREGDAERIAAAVGGGAAGLVGCAAYAIEGSEPATAFVLCEVENDPGAFLRLLSLVDVEARRYGGVVGAGAFLSEVPLSLITGILKTAMGLPVEMRQVIETHLAALGGA